MQTTYIITHTTHHFIGHFPGKPMLAVNSKSPVIQAKLFIPLLKLASEWFDHTVLWAIPTQLH